jgi:hypothetical protein
MRGAGCGQGRMPGTGCWNCLAGNAWPTEAAIIQIVWGIPSQQADHCQQALEPGRQPASLPGSQ